MADIQHWQLDVDTIRPKPVVNATIQMTGQFTWEGVAIREMFLRMRRQPIPPMPFLSREEIIARIQNGESPESFIPEGLIEIGERICDSEDVSGDKG